MSKSKQIQWYPGHMFKSIKEINKQMSVIDVLFILIDARLPISSMNPNIIKLAKQKPTIVLFNKIDLSDLNKVQRFEQYYEEMGFHTLRIDSQSGRNVNRIYPTVKEVLSEQIERRKRRGMKIIAFNAMILGIPNVGKSTLANKLAGSKSFKTANTPGVTRNQQWLKINNEFNLLDTPGVLWPKFDDMKTAYHLAITGAIKDSILPIDDVVKYAVEFLQNNYLNRLKERYSEEIEVDTPYVDVLNIIGEVRKAYLNKHEYDYDRIYQIVLTDIRNKYLGGLLFDELSN